MVKFQNKYRSESARASWWDYANDGVYFVTICTSGREWLFGEITNNEMNLSPIGEIVYQEWNVSFDIRAELFCDIFVIMPNHIHAILRIDNKSEDGVGTHGMDDVGTHGMDDVGTHGRASLHRPTQNTGVAYRSPKSISSFMAGFKSAATKRINEYRNSPKMTVWQTRFHDHIIRNDEEYQRIYNYIASNITNWEKDKFFKNETL
jgi:putative transposase